MTEPSMDDLVTGFVSNYETELATDVPSQRRSFLRVWSVAQAVMLKGLMKRVTAAQKAVFAVTAGADGLTVIAREFGVPREDAVKYVGACSVHASGGATIPAGTELTSEASGAYYKTTASVSESGGHIVFSVQAEDAGEAANLEVNPHALTFVSPIANVDNDVAITAVTTYGADEEDLEAWRARVLEAERAAYGGGSLADYRYWANQVTNVANVYPYSGRPVTWSATSVDVTFGAATSEITMGYSEAPIGIGTLGVGDMIEVVGSTSNDGFYTVQSVSFVALHYIIKVAEALTNESPGDEVTIVNQSLPGDRTVFVEADDADRIPSGDLLEQVREAIEYGTSGADYQLAVGDVDSTLYVEPVSVAEFYVEVQNLSVDSALADACKARVAEDLDAYFDTCRPFITGLDFSMDRRDVISDLSISKVVQGVFEVYAASADGLSVSVGSAGAETVTTYQLGQGEIAKLALVWSDDDPDWSA